MFVARFMSGLERYFAPCPTAADEKGDGCRAQGVGEACKWGSARAGWVGEGFFLTHLHPWIPVPWWQPDKLLPCPPTPSPASPRETPLQQGSPRSPLRVRTHFSQPGPFPGAPAFQDAGLAVGCGAVSVKGFMNHSGGPGFFPTLLSISYF